ncbi:MAG: DUF4281 domain-containing protein [Flavobacteriaceae bacterium]|nr:DUF4281 domain-containing protein [Bacteroidia bacterium]MBT8287646.1 DUF4281 domain-containing protein [Bacteroidia bacterium]NNF75539.1 DUF4281 domain-containing protein [Flavobacteriaceae bacterium]NNK72843.1 DUF4281 domain-containing protein [Flavobacteriaceae bacterium]
MTPSNVFLIANGVALIMWFLMIVLPRWKITQSLIKYKVVPVLLSIVYAIYLISSLISGPAMDFGSLQEVMGLFTVENAVLAGWLHYLAFDILVGMWMLDQNRTIKIHPGLMVPCLLATFMMGPIGFLIFMGIRAFKKNNKKVVI